LPLVWGHSRRKARLDALPTASLALLLGLFLSAGCGGAQTAYSASAEVCGAPPTNVEQELTAQAEVEISQYVQGGSGAGNKRKLTQVLSQQGLMCDALAYRACMAARAAEASAEQTAEMLRLAWDACARQQQAMMPNPTMPDAPSAPAAAPAATEGGGDGEWSPGRYMSQAVTLVTGAAQRVEQRTALGFDGDASCVLGAFLSKGAKITMSRSFEAGKEYAILGGGAEGTVDLDLGLQAADGTWVATDTENDATPVLQFKVPSTGAYTVVMNLADASVDGTFAAIAVMKEGGYRLPAANITKSFGSTMAAAAHASTQIAKKFPQLKGLVFHEEADWSFYGTVMAQGESITFNGIELRGPASVVLAASDGQASNVDLSVQDTTGGKDVGADTDPDANPLVIVTPTKGNTYAVRLSNEASSGPSLITALVLEAQP
jgi:hypothetical protein